MADEEVKELIRKISKKAIPSVESIFEKTVQELKIRDKGELYIRQHFEDLLKQIMARGLEILEVHQMTAQQEFLKALAADTKAFEDIADRIIQESLKGKGSATERLAKLVITAMTQLPPLTEFNISVGNMRKSRAGSMFQRAMVLLLAMCGIRSESGKKVTGRLDLVIPDLETFKKNRERCVLLELKGLHIRERWKTAEVEKHKAQGAVWIVTLDTDFGRETAGVIEEMGLRIYCPTAAANDKFSNDAAVRRLDALIEDIVAVHNPKTEGGQSTLTDDQP